VIYLKKFFSRYAWYLLTKLLLGFIPQEDANKLKPVKINIWRQKKFESRISNHSVTKAGEYMIDILLSF
jgi:hypothetical protein